MASDQSTASDSSSSPSSDFSRCTTPPSSQSPFFLRNDRDSNAKWIVQKYGGTSVGKFPVQIAEDIVWKYMQHSKVAVVCSARSGSTKDNGTTNLLLRAASEALNTAGKKGSSVGRVNAILDIIWEEHLEAARSAVRDKSLLSQLLFDIEKDCRWLRNFLSAARMMNEISPRALDTIVGVGERLACRIVTATFRDQGIDAEYISLHDLAFDVTSNAPGPVVLDQSFYDEIISSIRRRLKLCDPGKVPVVTGFFGPVPGSLLGQIGRGYTDFLAILLAVALQASELEIWKEVDGVLTADPRKVPGARIISHISPSEVSELTYYGSEVIHPLTLGQAVRKGIPIRIKNASDPEGQGTSVCFDITKLQKLPQKKIPTAVTLKEGIIVLTMTSHRLQVPHKFLAGLFTTLDELGVVVDLISTSEVSVSMAIAQPPSTNVLQRLTKELSRSGTVSIASDMAILSMVGRRMRNSPGIAAEMFTTLAESKVNVLMISQGSSETNISCVIHSRDGLKALNLVHDRCVS